MLLILCLFWIRAVVSVKGVDVSQKCLIDGWKCLKNDGYTFAIVRCYESLGRVDPNCPHTIYNAWDGGMEHVDAYIFPCPKCGNGKKQVEDTVNYLHSYKAKFGTIWLDIEGTQYWLGDKSRNQAFFRELLEGISSTGVTGGVYASYYQWEAIFGLSYSGASHLPLWYPHYDDSPSFSDFRAFGGWSHPAIKQYHGSASACGCGIDLNWYP